MSKYPNNQLDDLCGQNYSSFSSHEIKSCYDIDMVMQSDSVFFAAEASFQKPSEHPQSDEEVLKDTECIVEKSSLEAELFDVENQKMDQTYTDPVAAYGQIF